MSKIQDVINDAGPAASRPAAGSEGRLYFSTDTGVLERDTGVAWEAYSAGQQLIAETILTGSVASVTFSSIPQTYRQLLVITQSRTDRVAEDDAHYIRFNGDAGANYDWFNHYMNTGAHAVGASRGQTEIFGPQCEAANSRASNFSGGVIYVFGYALTDREKWVAIPVGVSFGDVSADADMVARHVWGRWRSTAAITSIVLTPRLGVNFVSGSRFTLYGVT